MRLEPLVNPLLDENDLVRLGFLLQKAVDAMRSVENSRAFHFPVERRRYPVSATTTSFLVVNDAFGKSYASNPIMSGFFK